MAKTKSAKASKGKHRTTATSRSSGGSIAQPKNSCLVQVVPSVLQADPIVCSFPSGLPQSLVFCTNTTEFNNSNNSRNSNNCDLTADEPKFLWKQNQAQTPLAYSLLGKDEACLYRADWRDNNNEKDALGRNRNHPTATSRLFLGVYDKQSHTLTLQPTAGAGSVWALQQSVPSYSNNKSASATTTTTTSNNNSIDYDAAAAVGLQKTHSLLFADFGSSKKQKVLRSQQANQVRVEQVVGSAAMTTIFSQGGHMTKMSESNRKAVQEQRLQQQPPGHTTISNSNTTGAATGKSAIEAATWEWRNGFLPKYNVHASRAHQIYKAQDMAGGAEVWALVSREVDACCHRQDTDIVAAMTTTPAGTENGGKADFDDWRNASVRSLLNTIASTASISGPEKKQQLRCVLLLNHFLNLYLKWHRKRFIPAPLRDRPRYMGVPLAIAEAFLEQFTTQVTDNDHQDFGYCMSKANKDKCLVHLLLLFLLADSGGGTESSSAVSTTTAIQSERFHYLADDLGLDVSEASHLLRQAGCIVRRDSRTGLPTAVLKTPLEFPAIKTMKKKASRR
jgi:hypothetical protein